MPVNLQSRWKGGELAGAALAGVCAAIPGMAALRELELPAETKGLFSVVLAIFSAAAVALVYLWRDTVRSWPKTRVSRYVVGGFVVTLITLVLLVSLVMRVWVPHTWREGPSRTFVPLFLSDSAQRLIEHAGSRSQALSKYGADYLAPFATETNIALTLAVLVIPYTLLVASLAGTFGLVYVYMSRGRES